MVEFLDRKVFPDLLGQKVKLGPDVDGRLEEDQLPHREVGPFTLAESEVSSTKINKFSFSKELALWRN